MTYTEEYKRFIDQMDAGVPVIASEVGKLISKLAQYFGDAVIECAKAERIYNKKLVEFEKSNDENGKPLSSTKAEHYANETDEHYNLAVSEGNVKSIETMINALKSLQKGLGNEYSHIGNN